MKTFHRGTYMKTNMIGSWALGLGVLIMLPSLSATEAQSSKQTASGQTKHATGTMALTRFSS
jgi:hypothetical protein